MATSPGPAIDRRPWFDTPADGGESTDALVTPIFHTLVIAWLARGDDPPIDWDRSFRAARPSRRTAVDFLSEHDRSISQRTPGRNRHGRSSDGPDPSAGGGAVPRSH